MNTRSYYPSLTERELTPFRALQSFLEADPDYLNNESCPYSADVRSFLTLLFAGAAAPAAAVGLLSLSTPEELEKELASLYYRIRNLESTVEVIDAKDKVQWAKALVSMMERMVELRERVFNVRQLADFQKSVLACLEEVLEPAQRTAFVDKLSKFVSQGA